MIKFFEIIKNLFVSPKKKKALFSLEETLLAADLGPERVAELVQLKDERKIKQAIFDKLPQKLSFSMVEKPEVVLLIGVNGVGKTTTLAKIASYYQSKDKKILLAAGDTFRAAATTQLKVWGQRLGCSVVSQKHGADAAAVAYDSVMRAKNEKVDLLLIDTAGRQHTKDNLMEELKKIKRVAQKANQRPLQVWLVLEGHVGQTGLTQAKAFHDALGVTGLILTKLDGSAKGGILFSISKELNLPVVFLGVGEGLGDLKSYDPNLFAKSLIE